jgi:flagellar protein FliS
MNSVSLYQETSITTQNKGKLIVLLYDGAINFLNRAIHCIDQEDIEGKNRCIGKARDIIFELNSSLNLCAGGDLAGNLRSLYNFIWIFLGRININNETGDLKKVIQILSDVRHSWQQVTG